jgi:hypothetical protein
MSNTRSGRTIRRVGETDNKKSALSNLAKLRKGEGKRTEQYDDEAGMYITQSHMLRIRRDLTFFHFFKLA